MAAAIRNTRTIRGNHSLWFSTTLTDQSRYRKQISLANLFQRYGFPSSQIPQFLKNNPFLFHSNLPQLENSLSSLLSLRIPQNTLVSLIRNCPSILEHNFLSNWKQSGFFSKLVSLNPSPSMIANFLECSRRFELDPAEVSKRVETLKGLGFSCDAISRVLEGFPSVIVMSEREVARVVEFLVEFGIPKDKVVDQVLRLNPRVLGIGVEERLKPLIRELRELGFSGREIRGEIVREPRILGMEVGEFSRCLRLLEGLTCREGIKERVFGEGLLRACFEVKLRVDCLCSHGLIRRDALKLLWKEPRLITYGLDDIEKKIHFLVHRMKYNVDCLPDVPEYLGVNFEKQVVPRYNVIEYLTAKGAIGFEVGLKDMVKPSRLRFYNLYVKPYPECEKIYGRFSGTMGVKSKHPAGLWKLFKPQKFPETDEDAKNLKAFMDSMGNLRVAITARDLCDLELADPTPKIENTLVPIPILACVLNLEVGVVARFYGNTTIWIFATIDLSLAIEVASNSKSRGFHDRGNICANTPETLRMVKFTATADMNSMGGLSTGVSLCIEDGCKITFNEFHTLREGQIEHHEDACLALFLF